MRITQEADDAVLIIGCIAERGSRMDARAISEATGITLRFTLKILRKLVKSGILRSFFGVSGGYELQRKPSEISLLQVIEAVDGPIAISRCLSEGESCGVVGAEAADCDCRYRRVFADISQSIRDQMKNVNFEKRPAGGSLLGK